MTTTPDALSVPDRLYRFRVTADLCPQGLLRILGLIAQNSLIPRELACERHVDGIDVTVAIDGLSPDRADLLLAKIAMIVTVREAALMPGSG